MSVGRKLKRVMSVGRRSTSPKIHQQHGPKAKMHQQHGPKAKMHQQHGPKAKTNQVHWPKMKQQHGPKAKMNHVQATFIHAKCHPNIDKMHANILLQMKMNQAKCHPIRLLTESYICSNSTYLAKCYHKMQPNIDKMQPNTTAINHPNMGASMHKIHLQS